MFWKSFIDPSTKTLKTAEEIREGLTTSSQVEYFISSLCSSVFTSAGVDLDRPIVASCGGGVTACWIALGAKVALNKEIPVFVVSE